ncbi:MAG TPA: adenosylcobinamide-GDP ribazoletransferase [Syntrophobacteraceae bacterium]|nr:adenosylcobinamide-GDP ribazoletransferase [Syntrophobacteraceae bacterium]
MWRQFTIALSFLTVFRLPVSGQISGVDSGRCFACFPVVGLLIGLMTCLMVLLLNTLMPPILLAAWACAFMTFITRGFHLDGLADLADGLGGGFTPERRLEIMKDSATGAFGAIALVLALLLKACAIYSLIMAKSWLALAVVPALGRFAIVVGAYKSSCARTEGLARSSIEHLSRGTVFAAASFAVAFTLLLAPRLAPALLGTAVVIPLLVRSAARRLLGGITGDVLGAINELTEVFLLTLSACLAEGVRV